MLALGCGAVLPPGPCLLPHGRARRLAVPCCARAATQRGVPWPPPIGHRRAVCRPSAPPLGGSSPRHLRWAGRANATVHVSMHGYTHVDTHRHVCCGSMCGLFVCVHARTCERVSACASRARRMCVGRQVSGDWVGVCVFMCACAHAIMYACSVHACMCACVQVIIGYISGDDLQIVLNPPNKDRPSALFLMPVWSWPI